MFGGKSLVDLLNFFQSKKVAPFSSICLAVFTACLEVKDVSVDGHAGFCSPSAIFNINCGKIARTSQILKIKYQDELVTAEKEAREKRMGVWEASQ